VTESAPPPQTAPTVEPTAASAEQDVTRTAGRGGLAISVAKAYFMVTGLVGQIALPRVLGLDGFGAWSSANSIASITYNPVVTTSIQGVSWVVTQSNAAERPVALRRVLRVHVLFAVLLAAAFYLLAPLIAARIGAPHVAPALGILSGVMLLYGIYAPLVGALNGQRRFYHQAGLDISAATLRTLGLIVGAWWFAHHAVGVGGVEGASLGFVAAMAMMLGLALGFVGIGRPGRGGVPVRDHLSFVLPILFGQILLNLLLQADLTLLRAFAADAAVRAGLPLTAADPLVGAYRATQLFSFLPYQLLIAVTFVLFPMLSSAARDGDRAAVARYVQTGLRLALVMAGLMVSVTAGLSNSLLRLVYGEEAARYGGRSLELLSLGFGAFAIFGIMTTVLNSLKHERQSALVTGTAVALVVSLCFWRVRGEPFGEDLLFRTAIATACGLALATVLAGFLVWRAAGAVVRVPTLLRTIAALAFVTVLGRQLPYWGKLGTLLQAALLALLYVFALIVTRELGRDDLATIGRVLRRKRA
jgi:stage V sporulation protein B